MKRLMFLFMALIFTAICSTSYAVTKEVPQNDVEYSKFDVGLEMEQIADFVIFPQSYSELGNSKAYHVATETIILIPSKKTISKKLALFDDYIFRYKMRVFLVNIKNKYTRKWQNYKC